MIDMRGFDPEKFRQEALRSECGTMDRKAQLYVVYGKDSEKTRAEFIRDMIALANTGRRRGQPAYLIFGVVDDVSTTVDPFVGIENQCSKATKPKHWDARTREYQQIESIGRDYQRIINEYVMPAMDFQYVYGEVDGRLVSYVAVEYTNKSDEPFQVKKAFGELKVGDCWHRIGESKVYVHPHEKRFLCAYDQVPYVSRAQWEAHFAECVNHYPVSLDQDIPLKLEGDSVLRYFEPASLGSPPDVDDLPTVTLLTGDAGAGKTTFLRRLMVKLSENVQANLRNLRPEEPPSEPIPIYVNVSEYHFPSAEAFKQKIIAELDRFRFLNLLTHEQQYAFIEKSGHRFIVLVDGLDEVESSNASQTLASIKSVVDGSPSAVKYVIAGRTARIRQTWHDSYSSVVIHPVNVDDIEWYVKAMLQEMSGNAAVGALLHDEDLRSLVSTPLGVQSFTTVWQEWEAEMEHYRERRFELSRDEPLDVTEADLPPPAPTKAQVVQAIIEAILRHDQAKGNVEGMYEQLSKLSHLALGMRVQNQRHRAILSCSDILGSDIVRYFCSLGFLVNEQGNIRFASPLLLDYLTAYKLKELIDQSAGDQSLTWQRCAEMLESLVNDVMPLLIYSYAHNQYERN